MRATNQKGICTRRTMRSTRHRDPLFLLSSFLGLVVFLSCSFGCAPSSSLHDGGPASASSDLPEITEETIRDRISWTRVRQVPEENGTAEPISWFFYGEEPKEITVVEKQVDGEHATIVLDIKTQSSPRAREQRYLAGQIRTEWELQTGWLLRKWEIVRIENISMKYRNLPKPPSQNSNH
jgi:hypothetical protein